MSTFRFEQGSRASRKLVAAAVAALAAVALAVPATAGAIEPLGQFGEPGLGAGGIAGSQGIGIDGNGRISLAQTGINRVSNFDRDGNFVNAYGNDVIPGGATGFEVCTAATTCGPGTPDPSAGSLSAPWDVALPPAGDAAYVAEVSNNRVSRFSAAPAFTAAWGYDVIPGGSAGLETCTAATGCQGGSSGISVGQFASPGPTEMLPDGSVAVANLVGIVNVYSPDGGFEDSFGFPGSAAGQLSGPYGMAVDAAGATAFAEINSHRVSFFGPNGTFLRAVGADVIPGGGAGSELCTIATTCKAGVSGTGAGELNSPSGAAYAPDGTLYVSELSNQRVSQFASDGQFLRAFGHDVIPGGGTGFEICTAATGCKVGVATSDPGGFSNPIGLATDCRGSLFVVDTGNQRVQKLGEPGTRTAPCPSNAFTFGKPKLNKKKGTAKLPVEIPGPGDLVLAAGKVKGVTQAPTVAGEAMLPIKPKGGAKKKLKRKGKAKVKAKVTFTPVNGDPNTQTTKVKLKKKAKR